MQQMCTIAEEQQTPKRQLFCHGTARSQCILLAARPSNISQRTPLLLWHLLLLVLLLLDRQATAHWCSTSTSAADQRCCRLRFQLRYAGLLARRHNELFWCMMLACYVLLHRFATRLAAHACRSG
jgi:hypothetical protein